MCLIVECNLFIFLSLFHIFHVIFFSAAGDLPAPLQTHWKRGINCFFYITLLVSTMDLDGQF